jgi:hypothetical protein
LGAPFFNNLEKPRLKRWKQQRQRAPFLPVFISGKDAASEPGRDKIVS